MLTLLAVISGMLPFGYAYGGDSVGEMAQLHAGDVDQGFGQDFGRSVAVSGDWAVVGAPEDNQWYPNAGAAYVYRRSGTDWVEQQKLFPLVQQGQGFGWSVAIDANWIVVGAPDHLSLAGHTGRGYVFQRADRGTPEYPDDDSWVWAATLHPPPSHLCCSFGSSVAVDGDVIAVGMNGSAGFLTFAAGRAYVFRFDGLEWVPEATLVGSGGEAVDLFGTSVDTSEDLIVVGAHRDDNGTEGVGSAYVFRFNGLAWVPEAKLVASDAAEGGLFGIAVTIAGRSVAVASSTDDEKAINAGAVYTFEQQGSEWDQIQKLFSPNPLAFANFGLSISGDGDALLITTAQEEVAYVFSRASGSWDNSLTLSNVLSAPVACSIEAPYALVGGQVYAVGPRVSLSDYAEFEKCFTGTDAIAEDCQRFNFEPDGRIDLEDFAMLLLNLRGP